MKYAILLATALLAGCAAAQPACDDYHIYKCDGTYDKTISNPYYWTLCQFADGPVEGPDAHEYAKIVLEEGLKVSEADLDFDGIPELFVGSGAPARNWGVTVFTQVEDGYRYIGSLGGCAFRILPKDEKGSPRMLVYEPCGGHYGYIKAYTHDGTKFLCTSSEGMHDGDGAPDENNRRLDELFFSDPAKNACLKWRKR
jgi:hypothetical protein